MENLKNIKHNLENVVLLYQSFRFDDKIDSISVEYEDPEKLPVKELQKKLRSYFLDQRLDTINITPLEHLDFTSAEAEFRSYSAFRRIGSISVNGKSKLISFNKYSFLSSLQRAEDALSLLNNNNIGEFKELYPEFTELALYDETDHIMVLMHNLESMVTLLGDDD